MPTITELEAKTVLNRLIDDAAMSHQPVVITGERHNAVLVSQDDWSSIQETLYLLSIPGMRDSIREGIAVPVDECAKELVW